MSIDQFRANSGTIHLIVCIIAIVVGVLMFADVFHVGAGYRGFGVVEVTLGILGLV